MLIKINGIDFDAERNDLFVDVMDQYVLWRLKDILEDKDFDGSLAEVHSACTVLITFME